MSRDNSGDKTPTNSIEQDADEERRLVELFKNINFVADSPGLVCPRKSKFTLKGIVSTPCDLGERHLKAQLKLPDLKERSSMSSMEGLYELSQRLAVTTPRRAKSLEEAEQPEEIAHSEMELDFKDTPHVQAQERKVTSQQPEEFSDQEKVQQLEVLAIRERQAVLGKRQPNQALWKSQSLPALWKSPSVPALREPQAVAVPSQSQAGQGLRKRQANQVIRKRQAIPALWKSQIVPVIMQRQAYQELMQRQAVPIIMQRQAVPIIMQRQAVTALMQRQTVPRPKGLVRLLNYPIHSPMMYRLQRKNNKKAEKKESKTKSGHVLKRIVSSHTFHWFVAIVLVTLLNLYIVHVVVEAEIMHRNENNVCDFNTLLTQYLVWFGSLFN